MAVAERRSSRCTGWATISSCSTRARAAFDLTPARRRAIADRRLGVGCDQLIVLEPPTERDADVFMRIYNPDGGEAGACGNATRCVASVLMDERKTDHVTVQTISGLLESQKAGTAADGLPVISVDMGPARLDWRDIPVREACDTNHLPVGLGPLQDPVGTNMGNPHATFFVDDVGGDPARRARSASWSTIAFFPERANIGVAQLIGRGQAPAAGLGARRRPDARLRLGRLRRRGGGQPARPGEAQGRGDLDGGTLTIEWLRDGHVLMTGGIALAFKGELDRSLLA